MMTTRDSLSRWATILTVALLTTALAACGGAQARKAKHMDKGHAYLAAGNFEKARVELRNALQIAPNDPEARYENGVVDEKLGNPREAAQFYQGAIDVNPDHVKARSSLARLYLFAGAPERSMEIIKPALEKHPDDAESLAIRAAARVQQKDVVGGKADAERAVQLEPANQDAVATLAGIYVSLKETDHARTLLQEAIKRTPTTVDLRIALAQLYAGQHQMAETEQVLLDIIKLRPTERADRIRLAQYYVQAGQVDAAERVLRDAVAALPTDRYLKIDLIDFLAVRRSREIAEKELLAMIAADPKDFELKFALGTLYERSNKADQAEKVYRQVIDSEKLQAPGLSARNRLAALYVQKQDADGAQKLVAEVLAKSPRDNDALVLHGNIALAQKDPRSAIADLRAVLRDQPNSIPVLRSLARAHVANGEPAIAEETMRRALDANPKDPVVRLDLAQLLAQLGKPDQAKPIVSELVKDQPNNVPALDVLFKISAGSGDMVGAQSAADAMVATQPKLPAGYFYQGLVAENQQHNEEALKLFRKAQEFNPDALDPLRAEVQLLVKLKRVPDALARLDQVTAARATNAVAPHMKGQLLLATDRPAEAQGAFKLASQRQPGWWEPYRGIAVAQLGVNPTDFAGAIATLRKAEPIVEEKSKLDFEIAVMLERAGKADEAIAQYESIYKREPKSDAVANNLAMLLVTHRKDAASVAHAKSLTDQFAASTNPSFMDTYAWVMFKAGKPLVSLPILEKVVAQYPDSPVVLYHLGMVQSVTGKSDRARENLKRAVDSGQKFEGASEAKSALDKLANEPASQPPKT